MKKVYAIFFALLISSCVANPINQTKQTPPKTSTSEPIKIETATNTPSNETNSQFSKLTSVENAASTTWLPDNTILCQSCLLPNGEKKRMGNY